MTLLVTVLTAFVLATWVLRHSLLNWTIRHGPILTATTCPETISPRPKVTVIVPCRNEEHNIAECLDALLAQDYANSDGDSPLDIIVVDDRSEDRTAEIVEGYVRTEARVRLIRNTELPEGWTGKNYSLHLGARAAPDATFLLFVDADTRHAPSNLSQAVTYAVRNEVDMFSLILPIVNKTFWEKVVQPITGSMLCIRYPVWKVNDPASKIAFGNGQYILIRRETYDAVGGHEAVRGVLLEDIAMAKRIKHSGHNLKVAYAKGISHIRMYRSLTEIWNGWARIFLSGMNRSLTMMSVGVLMMLVFSLLPYMVLFGTSICLLAGESTVGLWTLLGLSAVTVATEISMMARFFRAFHSDPRYVVFHLLGCLIGLGILLSSISMLYSRRGLVWKGTRYDSRANSGC